MNDAYIAGVFDGDGSVNVTMVRIGTRVGYVAKAEISQCNREFLEKMNAMFDYVGTIYADPRSAKYTVETNYSLRFVGKKARAILNVVQQHAILKAEQARLVLDMLDLPRLGHSATKECIRARVSELNAHVPIAKPFERMCDAYIAGVFDAEGNVYIGPGRRRYVKITQVSEPNILHVIKKHLASGHVDATTWKAYSSCHIEDFVRRIHAFTFLKHGALASLLLY